MNGENIAVLIIGIIVNTLFILMGMVLKSGHGADFITLFNEKKHDRVKASIISGNNLVMMGSLSILNTIIYCFSNIIKISESMHSWIGGGIIIFFIVRIVVQLNKTARIEAK